MMDPFTPSSSQLHTSGHYKGGFLDAAQLPTQYDDGDKVFGYGNSDKVMSMDLWNPSHDQQANSNCAEISGNNKASKMERIGEVNPSDKNKKQPTVCDNDFEKYIKSILPKNIVSSSTNCASESELFMELHDENGDGYGDVLRDDYDDGGYEFDEDDNDESPEFISSISVTPQFDDMTLPPWMEAPVPWLQDPKSEKTGKKPVIDNEVLQKHKCIKQFDTVKEFPDHYFSQQKSNMPTKDWVKCIQNEWKILEKDLPESIFVRVSEEKMDLLRAVLVGPAGTPYHDGLFFFDVQFPLDYPNIPPLVHYHAGGLRLNPNLYECGKVCLSLLGTWDGDGCENWIPGKSTVLQVLVSIQALVLNEKPYFNEPGYEDLAGTLEGERESREYNEEAFLLSCKTMMYSMRKPPKNFEDFVNGHFCIRGHDILVACTAYIDDSKVCSGDEMKIVYEDLLMEFTVKGVDCAEFLARKVKSGLSKSLLTPGLSAMPNSL